jgi:hypothetical protein
MVGCWHWRRGRRLVAFGTYGVFLSARELRLLGPIFAKRQTANFELI